MFIAKFALKPGHAKAATTDAYWSNHAEPVTYSVYVFKLSGGVSMADMADDGQVLAFGGA